MTRSIAEIHGTLLQAETAITRLAERRRHSTTTREDIVWAALTLARDSATCTSILAGRAVLTQNLDPAQLRHALRGAQQPAADAYIEVTKPMLHAILEAGPRNDTWPDIPDHLRPKTPPRPAAPEPPPEPPPDHATHTDTRLPRITPPRTYAPR